MREIDRVTIKKFGIPETILMENAGLQSLYYLKECLGSIKGRRFGIFCGKGSNGGDGFVLARQLEINGADATVYLLAKKSELRGDAKLNMKAFSKMGGEIIETLKPADIKKLKSRIRHEDALVDAMLGTGINSALKGVYKTAVESINEWADFVLAIDIPTGMSSDSGVSYGTHIIADATITFGCPKTGMMFYPAARSVGELMVANISFPAQALDESPCDAYLLDEEWVREAMPVRDPADHKGSYGHAVVCGGATGMGGASGLAALAALKVGAGLVTAAVPHSLSIEFELGIKEVMSFHLGKDLGKPENAEALIGYSNDKSALLIGPGMGRGANLTDLVTKAVAGVKKPIVIDADAITNIAPKKDILKKAAAPVIITPHPGEMSRLIGISTKKINENRLKVAKDFSKKYKCITVLKGARTVIAAPDGTAYVNATGNPNLASGGSGDVLGGMIVGFLAQGVAPMTAAALAVYLHGLAADIYTEEENEYSLTASELIDFVPVAITKALAEEED